MLFKTVVFFLISFVFLFTQNYRPFFSKIISPLLVSRDEDFFQREENNLLALEIYFNHPLIFNRITLEDLEIFFFLSPSEKDSLIRLITKKEIDSLVELKMKAVLEEKNFEIFKYFIKFLKEKKKEKTTVLKYDLGVKKKNNAVVYWRNIEDYQIRNQYQFMYQQDKYFFNFFLFFEKDFEEKKIPQFFKFSFNFNWSEKIIFYLGGLSVKFNQTLLFSTQDNSFALTLKENLGYRKSSSFTSDKSKKEIYLFGLGTKYKWENLSFWVLMGYYQYHHQVIDYNPTYPQIIHSDSFSFNEEKNFSANPNSLKENIMGLYVEYFFPQLKLSGGFIFSQFNYPLIQSGKPYGKESYGFSGAWDYFNTFFKFYGEIVLLVREKHLNQIYSIDQVDYLITPAIVSGIRLDRENFFSTFKFRYLNENYLALHNNLYTAFNDKKNEWGIASSVRGKVGPVRVGLTLDYAQRISLEQDFLFSSLSQIAWSNKFGFYLKNWITTKNNLTLNRVKNNFRLGFKRQQWDVNLKITSPLSASQFNILSEISLALNIKNHYSMHLKLGWGREQGEILSFFFYHNSLFSDFIHLANDSIWILGRNDFFLNNSLHLGLVVGTIFKTNLTYNYQWKELTKELYFSVVLSGEL